jgi:TIR domain-containing protein
MKIFLSWSGERSRTIAGALNDWLKRVIQAVKPFYSPDIEKGSNWSNKLDDALEGTRFGIICLTPDNLDSTWIHYEAGALSKTQDAVIWTFLHGVSMGNVRLPLGKFQHTIAEKEDVFKMLTSINSRLADVRGESLDDAILRESFEQHWPTLEEKLKAAESIGNAVIKPPDQGEILLEILGAVRSQQRMTGSTSRADVFESSWIAPPGVDSYVRITTRGVPISLELQSEIFAKISNDYPNVSLTGDTLGDTSGFNLFFKEPTAISSVPDIVSTIEKMAGISDIEAKVMRVRSRFPIQ